MLKDEAETLLAYDCGFNVHVLQGHPVGIATIVGNPISHTQAIDKEVVTSLIVKTPSTFQ